MDTIEAVTGCEMPNKYFVYPLGPNGNKQGMAFFKCEEKSGFCER